MTEDLHLRRKWTLRAHGRQVVFVKKPVESTEHVLMKAFLWALYLPEYPDLIVEIKIGDRYKPDVVALDATGQPAFWGEAGEVSTAKIRALARRYRRTHFALGKWASPLAPLAEIVSGATQGLGRTSPFDLISFPDDAAERFIDDAGVIHVRHQDLAWLRI
ncbi:MAG: hypothetical protein ACM30E_00355 [Nitrososphaerales archaeon]